MFPLDEHLQDDTCYSPQAYVKKAKFWVDYWQLCLKTPKNTLITGFRHFVTSINVTFITGIFSACCIHAYCVKEISSLTSTVKQLRQPALELYQAMATIGGLHTKYGSMPKT